MPLTENLFHKISCQSLRKMGGYITQLDMVVFFSSLLFLSFKFFWFLKESLLLVYLWFVMYLFAITGRSLVFSPKLMMNSTVGNLLIGLLSFLTIFHIIVDDLYINPFRMLIRSIFLLILLIDLKFAK